MKRIQVIYFDNIKPLLTEASKLVNRFTGSELDKDLSDFLDVYEDLIASIALYKVGERVRLIEDFSDGGRPPCTVAKGTCGTITAISNCFDSEGFNFYIDFDTANALCFGYNFCVGQELLEKFEVKQ